MAKARNSQSLEVVRGTPGVFARHIADRQPLYQDHHGRFVLFDAEGPGVVENVSVSPKVDLLCYLDDSTNPMKLRAGENISFAKSLVISSDRSDVRFTANFTAYPSDALVESHVGKPKKPKLPVFEFILVETDRIDPSDAESRKAHKLAAQNESEAVMLDSQGRKRLHRSHLNRMSFDVAIDPQNCGVLIKRQYDRFHGRQRARVLINEKEAGIWYAPEEDRIHRWGEDGFFVPAKYTLGKSAIRVEVDPFAATPLWDVAEYRVFSAERV